MEEFGRIRAFNGNAREIGRRAQNAAACGSVKLYVERRKAERIDEILKNVIHGVQAARG